jgi:hypothetical protein
MTLQELIELAILDAMGLLEEDERELFEAAFRGATPAVQSQVRREQTRLSQIEMLLPSVTPPAGLRALVIQAVRDEMSRSPSKRSLLMPTMVKSGRVSPLWRAGSLGLAAAVLILTVTLFLFQSQHQRMLEKYSTDTLVKNMVDELGGTFVRDVLFNRDTQRAVFVSDNSGFRGEASIFVNPEWGAKFFCNAMETPGGRTYRLALVDENDKIVEVLTTFSSDGGLLSRDVALSPGVQGTLAIIGSSDEAPTQILGRAKIQG